MPGALDGGERDAFQEVVEVVEVVEGGRDMGRDQLLFLGRRCFVLKDLYIVCNYRFYM